MDLISMVNIRECILNQRQLYDSETSMKWNDR